MDEIIKEERKAELIERFTDAVNHDYLTNADALMVLQICTDACTRKQAELFENFLTDCILDDDNEEQDNE